MAVSNWDTLALNEKGEPIRGSYVSPAGVEVTIYKNCVYVRDERAWTSDIGWAEPTVMQIREGDVAYKDVSIRAVRGPQAGVYVAAFHVDWEPEKRVVSGMIGVGAAAYLNNGEYAGVQPECVEFLRDGLLFKSHREQRDLWGSNRAKKFVSDMTDEERKLWPNIVVIDDDTIEYDVYDFEIPDEIREIDMSKALRVNQGDLYFSPVMTQAINSMKEE